MRARQPRHLHNGRLEAFARELPAGALIADLGCGPGWYADALQQRGFRVVAMDAVAEMLAQSQRRHPTLPRVQADLAALPFRDRQFDGVWAMSCYQHVARLDLPMALARLHWSMKVGAPVELSLARLDAIDSSPRQRRDGERQRRYSDDKLKGRLFVHHSPQRACDLLTGAGFESIEIDDDTEPFWMTVRARRAHTLPDLLGPRLRLLVCGLNPSLYSADRGIAFARPGNRFWPAAIAAGLVERGGDPLHTVARGIGMTDLVKRASARADEIATTEYEAGIVRLQRLVQLHRPRAVCFVGLDGWRRTVDKRAKPGWVEGGFAGCRTYLMPSTSGANASASVAQLTAHLRSAASESVVTH